MKTIWQVKYFYTPILVHIYINTACNPQKKSKLLVKQLGQVAASEAHIQQLASVLAPGSLSSSQHNWRRACWGLLQSSHSRTRSVLLCSWLFCSPEELWEWKTASSIYLSRVQEVFPVHSPHQKCTGKSRAGCTGTCQNTLVWAQLSCRLDTEAHFGRNEGEDGECDCDKLAPHTSTSHHSTF